MGMRFAKTACRSGRARNPGSHSTAIALNAEISTTRGQFRVDTLLRHLLRCRRRHSPDCGEERGTRPMVEADRGGQEAQTGGGIVSRFAIALRRSRAFIRA